MNFQDRNFPNGMNLIRNYGKIYVLLFCSPKKNGHFACFGNDGRNVGLHKFSSSSVHQNML